MDMLESAQKIVTIDLGGGPGGGKTCGLHLIIKVLPELGMPTLWMPEIATLFSETGRKIPNPKDRTAFIQFESDILDKQMSLRRELLERAEKIERPIILIVGDRGEMNIKSYLAPEEFGAILRERNLSEAKLLGYCTTAIHMTTAADGASGHYNSDNNPTRHETVKEAIIQDRKTRDALSGHPNFREITNYADPERKRTIDFPTKLQKLIKEVCSALGIPFPIGEKRRFLLNPNLPLEDPEKLREIFAGHVTSFDVYKKHLEPNEKHGVRLLRQRKDTESGQWTYFLEEDGQTEIVGLRKYMELLHRERDQNRTGVTKRRYCFPWAGQYCKVDRTLFPKEACGLTVLSVEQTTTRPEFLFPSFLTEHTIKEMAANYSAAITEEKGE